MKQYDTDYEDSPSDLIHVYPTFGREHVTKGLECWCHPDRDKEEPRVIVHHEEN